MCYVSTIGPKIDYLTGYFLMAKGNKAIRDEAIR